MHTQHKRTKLGMLTTTSRVAFSSISALPKYIASNDLISECYFLGFFLCLKTQQ